MEHLELQIVQATRSHLRTILSIEQQSFESQDQYDADDFWILYNRHCTRGFNVLKYKNRIIAYLLCYKRRNYYYIHSIAIRPLYRGKGIGKWIFEQHVLKQARELKCEKIFLEVNVNNVQAIALYTKLGFEVLKTVPNYYHNGDSGYQMELQLNKL